MASDLARVAALAADAKKAEDVLALDLTDLSDVCDAIVVATAANARLAESILEEVEERLRSQFGLSPLSLEGREDVRWQLMDYGALVVHVFSPEGRDFYRIERMWGDAPVIEVSLA